jgi:dTDP-4-dehydrorhamnose reductase
MGKKILITGGQGMFGRYLQEELASRALCPPRSELDIENEATVEKLLAQGDIDWVVNCAGTARGRLRSQIKTNALAAAGIARACAAHDVGMVFVSTARVFGHGEGPFAEEAPPCPFDDYGLSKYLGEQLVTRELHAGRYRIVRVSMALGMNPHAPHGQLLPRLLHLAARGEPVWVATDASTSVVHSACVARLLAGCLSREVANGIYHIASEDQISLYDLVSYVFSGLGFKAGPQPAKTADFYGSGITPPAVQGLTSVKWPACGVCRQAADLFLREWRPS